MSRPSPLTTWCRLLRLPNLFTVPGDPLAGFMLATGGALDWRVAGAMATSLLLYSAGLLLNDYFDRHVDARERPDRPIPSGAVSARAVLAAGLALLVAGVAVAFAVGHGGVRAVAVVLALTIVAYDAMLKRVPCLGPAVMGCCRAASVVLGATFVARPMARDVVAAAVIIWLYITVVSAIAAREAAGGKPGRMAYVPATAILVIGAMMLWLSLTVTWRKPEVVTSLSSHPIGSEGMRVTETIWVEDPRFDEAGPVAAGLMLLVGIEAVAAAIRARRGVLGIPPFVGWLIRIMVSVQAAWCVWAVRPCFGEGIHGPHALPLAIVGAHFLVRWLAGLASRRFYGS
ncbi:MAG: hypothetical protein FJ291_03225 [Planctomycetes bacterium]|nr:hypothetical protein [Planctomycetota bacterium]